MTIEEAIKALGLMEHVESIVAVYEPGEIRNDTTVRELKEACRAAAAALCAQQETVKLDRRRWEGCEHCQIAEKYMGETPIKYCAVCGRPLTEEAWAELERRINNGPNDLCKTPTQLEPRGKSH